LYYLVSSHHKIFLIFMIQFSPFPLLESERLIFRALNINDASGIQELRGNPKTMEYIPRPLVTNSNEALEHIKMIQDKIDTNEGINWAITEKGNDSFIGLIGHYRIKPEHFRCEIGYMLLPEYQNKGYISEAIKIVLDYGFNTMQMHSIEAIIDPRNLASEKVLLKNGFVKEAHILENECYNGSFIDTVIYSILKRNFK
jgi:[ribosomal protein S5]-alanine N-acetyltransferase